MARTGSALITAAVALWLVAAFLWGRADDQSDGFRAGPDRAPAFAVGGLGGVMFLSGVVVLVGAQSNR